MNDDDLSELILRASAYLDGELTADEMTVAEADPAVMAEVEALRELQAEVRDVTPAPDDVRESAIAAALAEFDALNAAHVPVPPADDHAHTHHPHPQVVPFRPRPAYTRWLTAAAAAVGIGVLGVVAVNGVGGGDDEEAAFTAEVEDTAEAARSVAAEATAEESFTAEILEAPAATEAADLAAGAAESAPATTAAASEDPQVFATEESAGDAALATEAPAAFLPFDEDRPIVGVAELAAVGAELLAGEADGTIARDVETLCELTPYEPYKRGLYDASDGTGLREVVLAIDPALGEIGAFDAATCRPIAVTPLP